jgi:hypothetical protein
MNWRQRAHSVKDVRKLLSVAAVSVFAVTSASCSSDQNDALCGPSISIGTVASAIAVGQYEFDETDAGSSMRLDVMTAINQVNIIQENASQDLQLQAVFLLDQFQKFLDISDGLNWNDLMMSSEVAIDGIVAQLNSDEGVFATTTVDSYIATVCGDGTRDVGGDGAGLPTLPAPVIPSPLATDPPMEMVNSDADAQALGDTVATLFGLNLPPSMSLCLGKTLSEISDVTTGNASASEYEAQFQSAFDACGIDFQIQTSDR